MEENLNSFMKRLEHSSGIRETSRIFVFWPNAGAAPGAASSLTDNGETCRLNGPYGTSSRLTLPYRIVVGDSSPSVQKAVQTAFPESDFRFYFFEDGHELFQAALQIRPDTVILALALGGRETYDLGRRFSEHDELKCTPLFFLKGTFEHFDADKAAGIAYEGIVQKPFDSEKLVSLTLEAIDRKISPPTLPEEPVLEGTLPEAPDPPPRTGASQERNQFPEALRLRIRELAKTEILEMERELEKRVKARVLTEIKEWLAAEKKENLS